MSMYDKMDADDDYTPEELARFRKINHDLAAYNEELGAWVDAGEIGPEPRDPGYTPEQISPARRWLSKRSREMCRKYEEEKRLRAERGEPEPDDEVE